MIREGSPVGTLRVEYYPRTLNVSYNLRSEYPILIFGAFGMWHVAKGIDHPWRDGGELGASDAMVEAVSTSQRLDTSLCSLDDPFCQLDNPPTMACVE